jgi:hypothetical protein
VDVVMKHFFARYVYISARWLTMKISFKGKKQVKTPPVYPFQKRTMLMRLDAVSLKPIAIRAKRKKIIKKQRRQNMVSSD